MINSRTDVLQSAIRESCYEINKNQRSSSQKIEFEESEEIISIDIEHSSVNASTVGPYYNEMSKKNTIDPIDPALIQLQQYHNKSIITSKRKETGKKFLRNLSLMSSKENHENKIEKTSHSNFYINLNSDENPADEDENKNEGVDKDENENENENLFDPIDKLKRVDDILFDRKNGLKRSESTLFYDLENQTETRAQTNDRDSNDSKALTMVVTHLVKWEKTYEFDCWLKKMFSEM